MVNQLSGSHTSANMPIFEDFCTAASLFATFFDCTCMADVDGVGSTFSVRFTFPVENSSAETALNNLLFSSVQNSRFDQFIC